MSLQLFAASRISRAILTLIAAIALTPVLLAADGRRPPNVIVIITDDQGYGEFSCHGNPITRTPNIDALASESIRLTDFHVAPMCTPTRAQLMTGLDAFRTGAINVSSGRSLLDPDLTTIADRFKAAGYRTGCFGKWHLGDNYPFRPHDRGFDHAVWFPSSHVNSVPDYWDNDYFDDTYRVNGRRQAFSGYCTDVFFETAKDWIGNQTQDSQPFFAYIATNAAHWPHFVEDRYRRPIAAAFDREPWRIDNLDPDDRTELISFLAMGGSIDDNIGRLDEFLRRNGWFDNTIIVFLTDNGSTMGEKYFNAGMRGRKTQLWEGGHRVPCFIRDPRHGYGPPREVGLLTQVQDLVPTLVAMADLPAPAEDLDGADLTPVFEGLNHDLDDRKLVINYSRMPVMEVTYTDKNPAIPHPDGAAVLWKHWRLLENRELYDLRTDPHQDQDVANQQPDIVAMLRKHSRRAWDSVKDSVNEVRRVVIGNDAENPLLLTACEWLDVFVDQQIQVRYGPRRNGTWHLVVDRAGRYRFTLRRFPAESGLKLTDSTEAIRVTDGTYIPAKSLPIASARIKIGSIGLAATPDEDRRGVTFEVELPAGPTKLKTWFLDASAEEICGAYYVGVTRL